jgi:TetR/AcrR family transcriptional repressor of nem operon
MRKSRQETEATRKRIVQTASEAFRTNGIAETGLKDLMVGAGLKTQGGFYKHFESKDQLVTEAIDFSLEQVSDRMKAAIMDALPEKELEALVKGYLSIRHRDRLFDACPLATLGSELRRSNDSTSEVTADGLKRYIALIAPQIKGVPADVAKKKATAIMSAMVGAVILSRIANNTSLSNAILKDTREFILQG